LVVIFMAHTFRSAESAPRPQKTKQFLRWKCLERKAYSFKDLVTKIDELTTKLEESE